MSVIDDTTTTQGWPLPHPNNQLQGDVLRLRAALQAADAALQAVQDALATKASAQETSDALQGLQDAVQALLSDVSALGTGKVASVNGVTGTNITLLPEHLKLGPANGPASSSITYDAQGRPATMTHAIKGHNATTSFSYDGQDRVASVQTLYRGVSRTEAYTYAADGKPSAMAATEVNV